ncbi:MAG: YfcE family phosphodiesterase [Oscillospiraceae bacterium]
MKLFVFSDSHGNPGPMLRALEEETPDMIIHLGDGGADISKIKRQFPQIPLKAVRGNCDYSSDLPETELFTVEGLNIFITHGHLFGVKLSCASLIGEAERRGAGLVMYGHTHKAALQRPGELCLLNPGSCGLLPSLSFAVVVVNGGDFFCRICPL